MLLSPQQVSNVCGLLYMVPIRPKCLKLHQSQNHFQAPVPLLGLRLYPLRLQSSMKSPLILLFQAKKKILYGLFCFVVEFLLGIVHKMVEQCAQLIPVFFFSMLFQGRGAMPTLGVPDPGLGSKNIKFQLPFSSQSLLSFLPPLSPCQNLAFSFLYF